jgi:hypothetical protein
MNKRYNSEDSVVISKQAIEEKLRIERDDEIWVSRGSEDVNSGRLGSGAM